MQRWAQNPISSKTLMLYNFYFMRLQCCRFKSASVHVEHVNMLVFVLCLYSCSCVVMFMFMFMSVDVHEQSQYRITYDSLYMSMSCLCSRWQQGVFMKVRYNQRWARLLTQQTSITIYCLPAKENKLPFSVFSRK